MLNRDNSKTRQSAASAHTLFYGFGLYYSVINQLDDFTK